MPIVTLCRSCDTVSIGVILDRCKYCGSQSVDTKYLDQTLIGRSRNRDILIREPNANRKAHTSSQKA